MASGGMLWVCVFVTRTLSVFPLTPSPLPVPFLSCVFSHGSANSPLSLSPSCLPYPTVGSQTLRVVGVVHSLPDI